VISIANELASTDPGDLSMKKPAARAGFSFWASPDQKLSRFGQRQVRGSSRGSSPAGSGARPVPLKKAG
jgi:hypothetical protein